MVRPYKKATMFQRLVVLKIIEEMAERENEVLRQRDQKQVDDSDAEIMIEVIRLQTEYMIWIYHSNEEVFVKIDPNYFPPALLN